MWGIRVCRVAGFLSQPGSFARHHSVEAFRWSGHFAADLRQKATSRRRERARRPLKSHIADVDFPTWRATAELTLRRFYGIPFDATGVDEDLLRRSHASAEDPADFAHWFAAKYDLDRVEDWGLSPHRPL